MKEIALFIPCYNEENRLNFIRFQDFIGKNNVLIDFYFVNDGSTDKTMEVLNDHFSDYDNVHFIKLNKNLGKGNALRAGVFQINKQNYKYLGFIDADLDIPLEQIFKLYSALEKSNCSIAVSSRGLYANLRLSRRSLGSVVMVGMANRIIKMRPKLKDTQCGCKLFKEEIIDICFGEEFISEWLFDIELFLRLRMNIKNPRNSICEVPLKNVQRGMNSNFKLSQNLKIFRQLYSINSYYN